MAKTKTPFFSFASRGTVGQALTSQKLGRATMLREKPVPVDFLTLPRQYQRWLYQDYAYLWTQQTPATQRQYAADGVRHHLTGYQYWIKYNLSSLPDIVGYWYLDTIKGGFTPDVSRNGNDLTVFGASLIPARISDGLNFDAVNNYLRLNHNTTLDTPLISIECFVYPRAFTVRDSIINKSQPVWSNWSWRLDLENGQPLFAITDTGAEVTGAFAKSPTSLNLNEFAHIKGTYDGGYIRIFVNGILKKTTADANGIKINTSRLRVGFHEGANWLNCIVDHILLLNRASSLYEAEVHSGRRYP